MTGRNRLLGFTFGFLWRFALLGTFGLVIVPPVLGLAVAIARSADRHFLHVVLAGFLICSALLAARDAQRAMRASRSASGEEE